MAPNLPPGDDRHGQNGYQNLGCKCEICRAANAEYQREYRKRLTQRTLPVDDPRHGTEHAYTNYCCRCAVCRKSHTAYARQHRQVAS